MVDCGMCNPSSPSNKEMVFTRTFWTRCILFCKQYSCATFLKHLGAFKIRESLKKKIGQTRV